MLKYAVPSWSNTNKGYVNRGDVMSLSTPSDKVRMLDAGSNGIVYGGWAMSWGQYGAHSALYCFKITKRFLRHGNSEI